MIKKQILLLFLLFMLCLGCDSSRKKYTFEEFKTEFNGANYWDMPIGIWFWDEFGDLEAQYGLNKDESKLLGRWLNATFPKSLDYNCYVFYPNKLFLIDFKPENFRVIDAEEVYFDRAVGTWEIAGDIVRITIYAIITEDDSLEFPNKKSMFFVERPYSFDFINIEDIDERGFTARPVNDKVLSVDLKRKVRIAEPNRTNNLYVRIVYYTDFLGGGGKDYGYFRRVPEMARENISGYEIATDAGLIKRFIFGLWP